MARVAKTEKTADAVKNMNNVSPDVINKLKSNGYDIHELKKEIGGSSKHDIFQNKNGDLFLNLKKRHWRSATIAC